MIKYNKLYRFMDEKRKEQSLSWKDVQKQARIKPSCLARMACGKGISALSLVKLLRWLRQPLETFISIPIPTNNSGEKVFVVNGGHSVTINDKLSFSEFIAVHDRKKLSPIISHGDDVTDVIKDCRDKGYQVYVTKWVQV